MPGQSRTRNQKFFGKMIMIGVILILAGAGVGVSVVTGVGVLIVVLFGLSFIATTLFDKD